MKYCPNCYKAIPVDAGYCPYCGQRIEEEKESSRKSFWNKLPSWAMVVIPLVGIIALIFLVMASVFAIGSVEGFASIILLIAGIVGFGIIPLRRPQKIQPVIRGLGIVFFAFMGATIDQAGNVVYNKPVEICLCDDGTSLNRNVDVSNPVPGSTYMQQDFTCYDKLGNPVKQINILAVLGIRFIEYLLLAYLLLGFRMVLWKIIKGNTDTV